MPRNVEAGGQPRWAADGISSSAQGAPRISPQGSKHQASNPARWRKEVEKDRTQKARLQVTHLGIGLRGNKHGDSRTNGRRARSGRNSGASVPHPQYGSDRRLFRRKDSEGLFFLWHAVGRMEQRG